MDLQARKEIAHEEHTYDEAIEMSETLRPVNVRNKNNLYEGRANVKEKQDLYDDLQLPQSIGFKKNNTCWLKGLTVVLVAVTVILIAVVIFLGIREGTEHRNQIDGGWNDWSVWTSCTVTCNSGIKIRQRQCANPRPSGGGQYCDGDPMDVEQCNQTSCPNQSFPKVDGGWSTWESWSECSASCGTGMASRSRSCSNPKPSNGDHCFGYSTEYQSCNRRSCPELLFPKVEGGWSIWGSWSECSASCGTGMASRKRSCSNPKPSNGGDYCLGESAEYQLCNRRSCPGHCGHGHIAFTAGVSAYELNNLGDHYTIVFDKVITQISNAYNSKTGIFTVPLDGAYVFTLTMMVNGRHKQSLQIVVDGAPITDILADASSVADYMSTTKQWILELTIGSKVWIRTSSYLSDRQIIGYSHTMFSGFLLFTSS